MAMILRFDPTLEIGIKVAGRTSVGDEWKRPRAKEKKVKLKKDAYIVTSEGQTGNVSRDIDDYIRMLRHDSQAMSKDRTKDAVGLRLNMDRWAFMAPSLPNVSTDKARERATIRSVFLLTMFAESKDVVGESEPILFGLVHNFHHFHS
jgi:hypothetical protein